MSEQWSGPPKDVGVYRGMLAVFVILIVLGVAVWTVGVLGGMW